MLPGRGYLRLQYIQDLNGLAVGGPINVEIARRIVRDAEFIPVVLGAEVNCMTWADQRRVPRAVRRTELSAMVGVHFPVQCGPRI